MFMVVREVRDLGSDEPIQTDILIVSRLELTELVSAADHHNDSQGDTSIEVFKLNDDCG